MSKTFQSLEAFFKGCNGHIMDEEIGRNVEIFIDDERKNPTSVNIEMYGVSSTWGTNINALIVSLKKAGLDPNISSDDLLSLWEDKNGNTPQDHYHFVIGSLEPGDEWALACDVHVTDYNNVNEGQTLYAVLLGDAQDIRETIETMRKKELQRIVKTISSRMERTVGEDPEMAVALLELFSNHHETKFITDVWKSSILQTSLEDTTSVAPKKNKNPTRL